jgi:hypothetical protein
MRLTFAHNLVRGIPERFRSQYPDDNRVCWNGKTAGEIYRALAILTPEEATPAAIAAIIGNKSWSYLRCDECGDEVERAVEIDECSDSSKTICGSCARAIAALAVARVA